MTDERGRKRDTPNGVFGPSGAPGKPPGQVPPRGAGLSGNLPSGSRMGGGHEPRTVSYANDDPKPGSVPISLQNDPRARRGREPHPHEPPSAGPWDGSSESARRAAPHEPLMAAARTAPPRAPTVRGVDGFAATRPAEVVGGSRGPNRSVPPSARPNDRGPSGGPPRPPEGKSSLRLKLEGDTYYEANEGRVKVPKRRGPLFFGFLFVLTALAVGAFLWIDDHGGIENFAVALKRVVTGEPDPGVQTSLTYGEPNNAAPTAPGTASATPNAQTPVAQPGAPSSAPQPTAAGQVPQPTAAGQPPAQGEPAAHAASPQTGQIATGEIEAPDVQPAKGAQPANETGVKAAEPPVAAKPKPKPVAAKPKPKPKPVVHRDPVLKVQPLGDVLNAAPPDPSGAATLPPPDPPAPD